MTGHLAARESEGMGGQAPVWDAREAAWRVYDCAVEAARAEWERVIARRLQAFERAEADAWDELARALAEAGAMPERADAGG